MSGDFGAGTMATTVSTTSLFQVGQYDGQVVQVAGRITAGDGGGGTFRWDNASTEATNGGTVFAVAGVTTGRWIRVLSGTLSVKFFGAAGDGVTDDYTALLYAATYINSVGKGILLFPPGDYFIGRYTTATNGVINPLTFIGCKGLQIVGNGARISLKGDYHRDAETTSTLCGIVLLQCNDVSIYGLEINGNLNLTTTAGRFPEPASYGVYVLSCNRVALTNLYIHHMMTDGVNIRDGGTSNPRIASKNVTGLNVVSTYNGRQGMSIVQGRFITFLNSEFSWTGRSAIGFSPQAGVDIEPIRSTVTAAPNQMDVNTGEVKFINCLFTENANGQFISGYGATVDGVHLDGCQFLAGAGGSVQSVFFIIQNPRAVVKSCVFDFGASGACLAYFGFSKDTVSELTVKDNVFYLRKAGQKVVNNQIKASVFEGNRIYILGTVPHVGTQAHIYVVNSNAVFRSNYVWVAKELYSRVGTGDRHVIFDFRPKLSEGNVFETDLLATAGATGNGHFANSYGATTVVVNDKYTGTAAGTADTFRPHYNSSFDTTFPYNQNQTDYAFVTYDPSSLANGAGTTTRMAVPGAMLGDFVDVSFTHDLMGITMAAWVSAAGIVSVRFQNESGDVLNLMSGTLRVHVRRP
ncbi:MAG: hypothetical protein PSX71_13960 [bacterium]|nr:hypothetical protein [bacterium]